MADALEQARGGMEMVQWTLEPDLWEQVRVRDAEVSARERRERVKTNVVGSCAAFIAGMVAIWLPIDAGIDGASFLPGILLALVAWVQPRALDRRIGYGTIPGVADPVPPRVLLTSTGVVVGEQAWLWRDERDPLRRVAMTRLEPDRTNDALRVELSSGTILLPVPHRLADDLADVVEVLEHKVTRPRTPPKRNSAWWWVFSRGAFVGGVAGYWGSAFLRVLVWREMSASVWWLVTGAMVVGAAPLVGWVMTRLTPSSHPGGSVVFREPYQYLVIALLAWLVYAASSDFSDPARVIARGDAEIFDRLVRLDRVDWYDLSFDDAMVALDRGMSRAFCGVVEHGSVDDDLGTLTKVVEAEDERATRCYLAHEDVTGEHVLHVALCALASDIDARGLRHLLTAGLDPNQRLRCPVKRDYPDWKLEQRTWREHDNQWRLRFTWTEPEPPELTPLFVVALRDDAALTTILLDAGARPESPEGFPHIIDLVSDRAVAARLRSADPALTGLERSMVENEEAVLDLPEVATYLERPSGRDALMDAALRVGADRVVEALVRDHGQPLPTWRALFTALEVRSSHLMETLLRLGVRADFTVKRGDLPVGFRFEPTALSLLVLATRDGRFVDPNHEGVRLDEELFERALRRGQIHVAIAVDRHRGEWGRVFELVVHQDHEALIDLAGRDRKALDARDALSRTPLIVAVDYGLLTTAELLVRRGVWVDLEDDSGRTAMLAAAEHGYPEMVELLIDAGASLTNAAHPDCALALDVARDALGRPLGRGLDSYRRTAARLAETAGLVEEAAEEMKLSTCAP